MQVFKHDENGFFIEPVILGEGEEIPPNCTEIIPPEGFYKAKLSGNTWVEGATTEEIENIKNIPIPLNPIDEVKKQITDLSFELMIKGVL